MLVSAHPTTTTVAPVPRAATDPRRRRHRVSATRDRYENALAFHDQIHQDGAACRVLLRADGASSVGPTLLAVCALGRDREGVDGPGGSGSSEWRHLRLDIPSRVNEWAFARYLSCRGSSVRRAIVASLSPVTSTSSPTPASVTMRVGLPLSVRGRVGFTNEENRDATGLNVKTLINECIPSTMWPGVSAGFSSAGRAGCQIALRSDTERERRGTACYVSGQTGSPLTSPSLYRWGLTRALTQRST